jgi:soluble lytic murein transglycosylase
MTRGSSRRRILGGTLRRGLAGALLVWAVAAPARAETSPDDLKPAKDVIAVFEKKDYAKARALAEELKDPLQKKALRWRLAQAKEVSYGFAELAEIYRGVKDWPGAQRIAERADEAIGNGEAADAVLAWFKDAPPRGYKGWSAYVATLARAGKEAEARDAAKRAWANVLMSAQDEIAFQRRFGKYIAPEDDRLRIFRLLRERRTQQAQALWARAILPAEDKAAIALRIVMQSRSAAPHEIEPLAAKLPEAIRDEADFRFDQISWNRRGDRFEAAGKLLERGALEEGDTRRWRMEGARVARELVDANKADAAYRAAAGLAAASTGETWATMEFLAGWIALRRLNKPDEARAHFARLFEKSGAAITKGRAAYWAARAAEAKGDKAETQRWLVEAAGFPHVFYGQLAVAALGRDRLALPADAFVPEEARKLLAAEEMARAGALFAALGEDESAHMLLLDLAMDANAPVRWAFVADFAANGAKRREVAVRASRRAAVRSVPLFALGFPTLDLPGDAKVEPAFAFSIIRQESEFYAAAQSPVGARGLMQLMPATAREQARRLKVRYDLAKLTSDESYNLRLGTDFLGSLVTRYGGLYPLAAAAYNAGPGNLNKWLARHGDPRDGKVDLVDWIESIPFEETRNYVQRVLENLAVYRHRAGLKSLATQPGALWRPPEGDALKLAPETPPEP